MATNANFWSAGGADLIGTGVNLIGGITTQIFAAKNAQQLADIQLKLKAADLAATEQRTLQAQIAAKSVELQTQAQSQQTLLFVGAAVAVVLVLAVVLKR